MSEVSELRARVSDGPREGNETRARVREYYRDETSIQVQGPGPFGVLAFERNEAAAGVTGGITHFGFRLTRPEDIDVALREVEPAGGRILRTGELGKGLPFAYVSDPDGYEIEIWFE